MDGSTSTPALLPGWGAGPARTHDPKLSATAALCPRGPLEALLLAEVDAVVLKLDVLDDERGLGAVLGLEDAALFGEKYLGLQVRLLLPEPAHVAQGLQVALDFHHGTPFLGHETWVLPDPGTNASCGRQGWD